MLQGDVKHQTVTLSPHAEDVDPEGGSLAEEFDSAGGSLNALIKRSAEKHLPLLGEQIRLRSFCASSPFPVVISSTQIDDILARLFTQARQEMQGGGTILLQATRGKIGSSVVLTFRYTAHDWQPHQETLITFHLPAHAAAASQTCL